MTGNAHDDATNDGTEVDQWALSHSLLLAILAAHGGDLDITPSAWPPSTICDDRGRLWAYLLNDNPDSTVRVAITPRVIHSEHAYDASADAELTTHATLLCVLAELGGAAELAAHQWEPDALGDGAGRFWGYVRRPVADKPGTVRVSIVPPAVD